MEVVLTLTALLAAILAIAFGVHFATAFVTVRRLTSTSTPKRSTSSQRRPSVSVVIPIAALERSEVATALSAFDIQYRDCSLLYCAYSEDEPHLSEIRRRIAASPGVDAKLLVGREHFSANPKFDNIEKGLAAAQGEMVAFIDSNVDLPPDMLDRLLAEWDDSTGMVSAAPIGVRPSGFWAQVECAFLNTFQARWLLMADCIGSGFAHGKVLLLRRDFLAAHGGMSALASHVNEDTAATKLVRSASLKVRLARHPCEQPLGSRSMTQVWRRQLRWAQLRRQATPLAFAFENLVTTATPVLAGLGLAGLLGWSVGWTLLVIVAACYATEAALATAVGWPWSLASWVACLVRDAMALAIWPIALVKSSYSWRGHHIDMTDRPRIPARTSSVAVRSEASRGEHHRPDGRGDSATACQT
jgi:ceramide glucosyltransferase